MLLSMEYMDPKFYLMFYTIVFIFGICIGSFLNVVILSLPNNEPFIKRSSHCMTCGKTIKPYDLIPLFSWIFLRGKCRNCEEKISKRYPIVEALNGILYVVTFAVMDTTPRAFITLIMFSLLIVIGFMDWDTLEMDTRVLLLIALLAVPSAIFTDELSILQRIIGGLCISVPFFLIGEISGAVIKKKTGEKIRGIELGDTFLMAAAGLVIGPSRIAVSAFFGIIIAAVVGMINKQRSGESKFAFGPYLAIGIAIGTLWGSELITWYLGMFIPE